MEFEIDMSLLSTLDLVEKEYGLSRYHSKGKFVTSHVQSISGDIAGSPQYKHRKWSQTFGFKHLVSSPYETMISSFFSVNGEGVFLDLDYGSSMVCG